MIIVSTCSVNIVEGDLIVAEVLVLVALVHHQVVCQAVRQATTCSLGGAPLAGGQKFVTGTPEL